jgi:hypothetical protein
MSGMFSSYTKFDCPECSKHGSCNLEFLELTIAHDGDEIENAIVSRHELTIVCPTCKEEFSAHADFDGTSLQALSLDAHPETRLSLEQPYYFDLDDWPDLDGDIPTDPYEVFKDTHAASMELLTKHDCSRGDDLLNRMVFAHQISALEAFLSDTIRAALKWHKAGLRRLTSELKYLKDEKVALSEILADPDVVYVRVDRFLRDSLFHDLPKVHLLYEKAFDIEILGNSPTKGKLIEAVFLRHDCVHRNGFTKDGKKLTVFTKAYVQEISLLMLELVERIQSEIMYQQYYRETSAGKKLEE